MKILPFDQLEKPTHSGYRPWADGNPNFEVVEELDKDVFIWFCAWGDGPDLLADMERARKLGRCIFHVTGDHCYVPMDQDGCFYFVTHLNPMSPCYQMQISYSFHQSLDWWKKGGRPKTGPRKYMANFQGSFNTNHKRRQLLELASDDIYIKERDGWQAAQAGEWGCIQEHSDLLLDSYFTLCPVGIGVSSIRVIEAIMRGSIPFLLDDQTRYFGSEEMPCFRQYGSGPQWDLASVANEIEQWMSDGSNIKWSFDEMERYRNKYLLRDLNLGYDNPLGITELIREEVEKHG